MLNRMSDDRAECAPWLRGSMTALATPFRDGLTDLTAVATLCDRQASRGTPAIVACGSTGEAAALSPGEQGGVVRAAVAAVAGRASVVAGCCGPATEAAVTVARAAAQNGAVALLCAPPPYVKPLQDGIVAHITAIVRAVELPVILYDVPGRVGVAVRDETVAALFERGLIVGIKDATGDLARPPRLRALCGEGLRQLSGDDATAAAHRAMGGHGCISVTANLVPALCAQMHAAWTRGDMPTFARLRDLLAPLHDALFLESNPIPLKAALHVLRLCEGDLRLPLTRASRPVRDRLATLLPGIMAAEEDAAGAARLVLVG